MSLTNGYRTWRKTCIARRGRKAIVYSTTSVVGHHSKALDLMALNFALPAEEGVAVIQTVLRGMGALADLRGCRHDHRHLLPAFDLTD
jgi:hypothetical protein